MHDEFDLAPTLEAFGVDVGRVHEVAVGRDEGVDEVLESEGAYRWGDTRSYLARIRPRYGCRSGCSDMVGVLGAKISASVPLISLYSLCSLELQTSFFKHTSEHPQP